MSALVHLAGDVAYYGTVRRQRCSWCGALIDEMDLARVSRALEAGEDPYAPWEPAHWQVGGLVLVEDGCPRMMVAVEPELRDGSPLAPENSCMRIDAAVTR